MYSRKDLIYAALVLIATFAVFRLSPIHTVYDSRYEMMFAQQLLWNHSFSLDARAFPELQSHRPGQLHQGGVDMPYHLVQMGDRFYYRFPPGSVILSIPYVALANAMSISATDPSGVYDNRGETQIQKGLAALLMAGLATIIFLTSRLLLSLPWSLLIAAAASFGTQVWSTTSRAMWSQTWGIFILGFVIWLVLGAEVKRTRLRPILLATCLAWLYFVRPTFGTSIIAVTFYVFFYHRKIFRPLVITGGIWLGAFILYSEYHFGQLLPFYYQRSGFFYSSSFWEVVSGNLISPSRGLFIYVPILVFVIYLSIRYGRAAPIRLPLFAGSVILAHLIIISLYHPWWAGHSYGPRQSTDLVPWFVLIAILGLEGRLRWREQNPARDSLFRVRTECFIAGLLIICSVILNGRAAVSTNVWWWNVVPENIDSNPSRVWDWKHPQFLGARPVSRVTQ